MKMIRQRAFPFVGLNQGLVKIGNELPKFTRTIIPVVEGADRYTYRSYELKRRRKMSLYFKRLRLIYLLFCLLFLMAAYPYLHYSWTVITIVLVVAVGYSVLRYFWQSDQGYSRSRAFCLDLIDYFLIGILIYLTGGLKSFFFGAYAIPIMATTVRFNIRAGLCGFSIAIALTGLNALADCFVTTTYFPPLYYLLFALGTMIIVIFSIGRLVEDELNLSTEIYHTSVTDPLTGLFHGAYIYERIKEEISRCAREGGHFAIIFLDLDRFKEINDRHGHLIGDGVLRHVAATLQNVARSSETLARYGGDEFLLLLPGTELNEAGKTLQRLVQAVESQPYNLDDGIPLWIGISGGTAEYPGDGQSLEQLLQVADQKMYWAKRGCYWPSPASF